MEFDSKRLRNRRYCAMSSRYIVGYNAEHHFALFECFLMFGPMPHGCLLLCHLPSVAFRFGDDASL